MSTQASITLNDFLIAARTVYGEARGEPFAGQLAVACVIANRLRLGLASRTRARQFGATLAEVCQKPLQFSCWNAGDPNRPKLLAADVSDPVFLSCLEAAARALSSDEDPTRGATHYVADWLDPKPNWVKVMHQTAKIGRHQFYSDV